jgi:hypothetical protein
LEVWKQPGLAAEEECSMRLEKEGLMMNLANNDSTQHWLEWPWMGLFKKW